ncbi:hypothetical protein C7212DRAFT_277330 [Tuber magnatum]|uniref:Uncharacterized protein n=1 Tax=Tuber magnatum TaxID=42249 RepID=A0A317SV66_9PEZI|nr:hypothetical protein C7212DRAFT_277330 [Tuber magnatum]
MSPITPLSTKTDTFSSITPLNTKTHTFSSTTTSSTTTSPECSPTTSSSPSNDNHTSRFFDKVKSFVPHHHHHQHHHYHHHQSKKPYLQPPADVPQQYTRPRSSGSMRGAQRRPPAALTFGRHTNEWLFGGVSVRRTVSMFFQHDN